jgi:hypothetical protein
VGRSRSCRRRDSATRPDVERERSARGPARHELPAIDAAALAAARRADRLLAGARERGSARWVSFLEPIPDRLRDEEPVALRSTARRARAAYGAKDSIADALPADLTEPFRDALDALLREIARHDLLR